MDLKKREFNAKANLINWCEFKCFNFNFQQLNHFNCYYTIIFYYIQTLLRAIKYLITVVMITLKDMH